ncbi:MAG: indole-3-glycerol-phosphate synthase [Thermoplasmataceae archaeon]
MIVERVYMRSMNRVPINRSLRTRGVLSLSTMIRSRNAEGKKGIIAEYKRSSPSGFVNRENTDLKKYIESVSPVGICGLSILTEPDYFRGTYDDVTIAHSYGIPVLVKDFIASESIIMDAYRAGGDCILLIADFLSGTELSALHSFARKLSMEVLIEFHDPEAYVRIPDSSDIILGYNRRDLRTLKIDPDERSALEIMSGDRRIKVLESGLTSAGLPELDRFDGMLVGEAMLNGTFKMVKD